MRVLQLTCLFVIVSGCAGLDQRVVANTIAFFSETYSPNASVTVVNSDGKKQESLEFAFYREKVEDKLVAQGYEIEADASKADHLAFLSYRIDDGTSKTASIPIIGQTGGGTTYSSGTVTGSSGGSAVYSGTSYEQPTFGVTGNSNYSYTHFKRVIELTILDRDSLDNDVSKIIYQSNTMSSGTCNVLGEVFDEMIEAMFTDFITENGKNRVLKIQGVFDC